MTIREMLSGFYYRKFKSKNRDFLALNNVSFEVVAGEILGIIGENGAGKSTLLKMLSKIILPTKGEVIMAGRVSSLLEVGTGFNLELSGKENIYLNGSILGMKKKEIDEKFEQIVDFSGVSEFLAVPVKYYSSGMRVRLAFAIAAHLDSDILILDEVLSVGDIHFQKKCLVKIDEITNRNNKIVIIVSHDMNAIESLCNKCIYLEDGKIKKQGKVDEVIGEYLLTNKKNIESNINSKRDNRSRGNVYIRNLQVSGINDLEKISSGESFNIKIDYKSKPESIKTEPRFIIKIFNKKNIPVVRLDSDLTLDSFESIPKEGVIICHVENFNLSPGVYSINISILSNGVLEDRLIGAQSFEVRANSEKYNFNSFDNGFNGTMLKHSFKIEKNER